MKAKLLIIAIIFMSGMTANAQEFQRDTIETIGGNLIITFIGHGTLMFEFQDKVFHIDPWSELADYSKLPKADVILITHEHGDHLDPLAISAIEKENTQLFLTKLCYDKIKKGKVLKNGDYTAAAGFPVEAVPAYNRLARKGYSTSRSC